MRYPAQICESLNPLAVLHHWKTFQIRIAQRIGNARGRQFLGLIIRIVVGQLDDRPHECARCRPRRRFLPGHRNADGLGCDFNRAAARPAIIRHIAHVDHVPPGDSPLHLRPVLELVKSCAPIAQDCWRLAFDHLDQFQLASPIARRIGIPVAPQRKCINQRQPCHRSRHAFDRFHVQKVTGRMIAHDGFRASGVALIHMQRHLGQIARNHRTAGKDRRMLLS
jgi:hypothetical protein